MTQEQQDAIAARYRRFAEHEARGSSPTYQRWAIGVAEDHQILAQLARLAPAEQQPNLVFAAVRWCGAIPGDRESLSDLFAKQWSALMEVVGSRSTQTNEVGRCAVLLPIIATLPQPVALLEVGASAGLCLTPDRYSYRYRQTDGPVHSIDPNGGPSAVALPCDISGPVPVPSTIPSVVWRAGIDLNPLDVTDLDSMAWLEALVWPEQTSRRERLRAAIALVRDAPPQVHRGDLNDLLPAIAARGPTDATLVVFHSAVLNYLHDPADRQIFVDTVTELSGHWISNEGRGVLELPLPDDIGDPTPDTLFTVALDGAAVALAHGHGRSLTWFQSVPRSSRQSSTGA